MAFDSRFQVLGEAVIESGRRGSHSREAQGLREQAHQMGRRAEELRPAGRFLR